jgi:hypothetical protein
MALSCVEALRRVLAEIGVAILAGWELGMGAIVRFVNA